jgi:hypothetical protein
MVAAHESQQMRPNARRERSGIACYLSLWSGGM